jgi:hypothetical protein
MADILKALKKRLSIEELLIFNVFLFVLIKMVVPISTTQLAGILEQVSVFNPREIIVETNAARNANNLPPLKSNYELDLAAQEKLDDMIKNGYFAHTSPSGVTPWYWFKDVGYSYTTAGENLALGYSTAQATVQAWMNSPSHRANLLNTKYEEIGVAVGKASLNGIDGVLVVQTFGKPYPTLAVVDPAQTTTPSKPIQVAQAAPDPIVSGASVGDGQPISTDPEVPPASQAVGQVQSHSSVRVLNLNVVRSYVGYLLALVMILLFISIFRGFNRHHLMHMAVNMALIVLTITLPALQYLPKVATIF